jgi:hypothetical protein
MAHRHIILLLLHKKDGWFFVGFTKVRLKLVKESSHALLCYS